MAAEGLNEGGGGLAGEAAIGGVGAELSDESSGASADTGTDRAGKRRQRLG